MFPFTEAFEEQVREALGKLYSLTELHDHPLALSLASHLQGLPRVQMVRKLLIDAIQELNAGRDTDFRSTQQRHYVLLQMRYVEEQTVQEVAQQLLLGERQYYREHKKAIQALCYLLWQRLQTIGQNPLPNTNMSLSAEIELAYSNLQAELVHLNDVLDGAIEAIRGLAEKLNVAITLDKSKDVTCWINVPALRQVLIQVLNHLLGDLSPNDQIVISAVEDPHPEIRVALTSARARTIVEHSHMAQTDVMISLLKTLNAHMLLNAPEAGLLDITLRFAGEGKLVLVIDDNPDATRLIERYLSTSQHRVAIAGHAEDGLRLAFELVPQIIILDVMLPGRDGWEILQRLKNHPTTRNIPVVVCSVLDSSTADLAFSLGANAYLHKPPGQIEFLKALAQLEY